MSVEAVKPTVAEEHLKDLLITLNRQWRIAMDHPGDSDRDLWMMRLMMISDRFSSVWFLLKLMELDPAAAEATTRELRGILTDGGGIGEWAYDLLKGIGVDPESVLAAKAEETK